MKIVTYNMLHDKRGKQNWSAILDKFDSDIVLAQESLAPDAYRQPLLESDGWCERVAWSPVNDLWGSAVYRIIAQGDRIRSWVNGVPCADFCDDMDATGFIGLQVHGIRKGTGPYQVRWKNIKIRELESGEQVE